MVSETRTCTESGHAIYSYRCAQPAFDMKDFGQINGRQIKYLTTTNSDWAKRLPTKNWLVIPFGDTRDIDAIVKVAKTCLDKKANYICAIGQTCELIHDIFDEEIVERVYVREELLDPAIYGDGEPMTTWHNDTEEGIWFSINAAFADKVEIDTVVILDMTENGGLATIEETLVKIAE